jgi:hypothetical protein
MDDGNWQTFKLDALESFFRLNMVGKFIDVGGMR